MPTDSTDNASDVTAVAIEPAELESARLRRLLSYWEELRGDDPLPPRSRFDPAAITYILSQVVFVEVRRNPLDFYFRVVGTGTEAAGQRGYQGKTVGAIDPPAYGDLLRRHYEAAVAAAAPSCHRIRFGSAVRKSGSPIAYERIVLPLADAAGAVGFLLLGSDWPGSMSRDLAAAFAESRAKLAR